MGCLHTYIIHKLKRIEVPRSRHNGRDSGATATLLHAQTFKHVSISNEFGKRFRNGGESIKINNKANAAQGS